MAKRFARFTITQEALVQIMKMPEGTRIHRIHQLNESFDSPASEKFGFTIEHEDFQEVLEGSIAPDINPIITADGWDWNIDDG